LYEALLLNYVKRQQRFIDNGLLEIKLWKDGDNSFHVKCLVTDHRYHLITGSNLNPRAWSLDLENGLLMDDPKQLFMPNFMIEFDVMSKNAKTIKHFSEIDQINDYPEKPRNLLKRLKIVQIDRILKRLL